MAKIILRTHPLDRSEFATIEFTEEVNALDLIKELKLSSYPLHCKVNGSIPENISDDFIFRGKDVVEISPLLEGGGGDGGKNPIATILTVAVVVAAAAVTGGAAAGASGGFLAAGSTAAALAGAAIAIGGNLLVNSLFPPDIGGNFVDPSSSLSTDLVDSSIGNSRNANPFGSPMNLALGNCCRIAPPFGTQPYSTLVPYLNAVTRYQQRWITNDIAEPCAQVCYRYVASNTATVSFYNAGGPGLSNSSYGYESGSDFFMPPSAASGDAAAYPHQVCYQAFDDRLNNSNLFLLHEDILTTDTFVYSQFSLTVPYGLDIPTYFSQVECGLGNALDFNALTGRWDFVSIIGDNTPNISVNGIRLVNIAREDNKSYGNPTGTGIVGYNGFRHKPWVFLCDPADPNFGYYVSMEFGNAFGWDPVAMAAQPDSDQKINGNPVLDGGGNVVSADVFCIANAEFCVLEEITEDKKTNKVHQIFNLGFGDLKISNSNFGTTSTSALVGFEEQFNDKQVDDWPMPVDSCAHERVDVTQGSLLPNNDIASGPNSLLGFDDFDKNNWIERCGIAKTNEVVVEIQANLYQTNPLYGIIPHTETIQIHYRPFNSTNDWLPLGNATGIHTLTGYDTFTVKEEFSTGTIALDKYCVRVRRLTAEDRSSNITDNINFTSVKWFQEDCKVNSKDGIAEPTNYKGQNRIATCLSAGTSQSGVLDKYNVKVSNNVWMFDIDEFKNTGIKNWVWDCEAGNTKSNNPAFQLLYFLRGGYCNGSADPVATPSTTPLDGGFTDFGWHNGEHPDNEELLWGGGLLEKEIDIDCICDWACFNHENEFCFDYYLSDDKSVKEVINLITRAGRATWSQHSGKLCPIWEEADQPFVTIFTEENIIQDSFQVCYDSRGRYDRVTVTYTAGNEELDGTQTVNDDESFDGKPVQITSEVPFAKERGEELKVQLVGVRKKKQALREANILAAKEFYQKRTYTWDTDIEHLCVTRGDIVLLSTDLTQASFSSRIREFTCEGGLVKKLYLTRAMEKPVDKIRIRLVCGDVISADVTKINDKELDLVTDIDAGQFPVFKDQQGSCNTSNLSNETFGTHPEDVMIIGAPMNTPGKRVRITNIDIRNLDKASITAVDDDPAIWAYEFDCCPDPVVLPDQEIVPFVCAKITSMTIEDCGNGLARVCYESDGAYAVQAQYTLNSGDPVNVLSNGQYTIRGGCFEIEANSGDELTVFIQPFVIGQPYSTEDGCASIELK